MTSRSTASKRVALLVCSVGLVAGCGPARHRGPDTTDRAGTSRPPGDFDSMTVHGRISEVTGAGPHPVGTLCVLELEPYRPQQKSGEEGGLVVGIAGAEAPAPAPRCRATVRCGEQGRVAYGGSRKGVFDCALRDGKPVTGRDESDSDGDPEFDMLSHPLIS